MGLTTENSLNLSESTDTLATMCSFKSDSKSHFGVYIYLSSVNASLFCSVCGFLHLHNPFTRLVGTNA